MERGIMLGFMVLPVAIGFLAAWFFMQLNVVAGVIFGGIFGGMLIYFACTLLDAGRWEDDWDVRR